MQERLTLGPAWVQAVKPTGGIGVVGSPGDWTVVFLGALAGTDVPQLSGSADHIAYQAHEFDARVGMPGLHTVRPKVEPIERVSILPREIFGRFVNESFWMDPKNNISQVPVV